MEARDADPVASEAAPVHDLHGPLVMSAKIPGGDDGYRQNLRIGDVRTPPVPRARGGCDAPGVPSRCQSRQKRLLSGERPSAPPGGDGWSDNRDRARDVGGRQLAIKV
jgi:hypothetical protein